MAAFKEMPKEETEELAAVIPPPLSGVEQSEDVLEWIWSNFSAVGGDQPSFECWRKFGLAATRHQLNTQQPPKRIGCFTKFCSRVGVAP